MLTITMLDNATLCIKFNFKDKATFQECVRRCKSIGATWDKRNRRWGCPVGRVRLALRAFPRASMDYDVQVAYDAVSARLRLQYETLCGQDVEDLDKFLQELKASAN